MERSKDLIPGLDAACRQDHELHATIRHQGAAFREAEPLETIDDPRRIRRVTAPGVGKRPHRLSIAGIQRVQCPGVIRCQPEPLERLVTVPPSADEELEESNPGASRQSFFVGGSSANVWRA